MGNLNQDYSYLHPLE